MLTNCLAACGHPTITVSEIQRDICEKNRHFIIPPCIRRPRYGGSRRNIGTPFGMGKTRMVSLPDGEKISKISLFVLAQLRNVTDRHRVTAKTALMHMHRAVTKTVTLSSLKTKF